MGKIFALILLSLISCQSFAITVDEAIKLGLNNSKEYQIQKYYLGAADNNKNSAMSEFLPNISLSYQTGKKQNIRSDNSGNDKFRAERTTDLSFSQPIFNGMSSVSALKKGQEDYLAQKFSLESFKRELILKIINSYIDNFTLNKNVMFAQRKLNYYKLILQKIKEKASLISENEIIDSKIGYYNAKNELQKLQNQLSQKQLEYKALIGMEPNDLNEITDNNISTGLQDILLELEQNPDISQKRHEVSSARYSYKKEVGNLLPKINVLANYNNQENLVYLDGGDLESKSVFLEVKVPLFAKGQEYFAIKKSKYDFRIKQQELDLTIKEVEKNVKQIFKEYNYAKVAYQDNIKILNLTNKKLAKNQKSYDLQVIDIISLLKIKIARNDARNSYFNSKADLDKAYYQLKLLTSNSNLNL